MRAHRLLSKIWIFKMPFKVYTTWEEQAEATQQAWLQAKGGPPNPGPGSCPEFTGCCLNAYPCAFWHTSVCLPGYPQGCAPNSIRQDTGIWTMVLPFVPWHGRGPEARNMSLELHNLAEDWWCLDSETPITLTRPRVKPQGVGMTISFWWILGDYLLHPTLHFGSYLFPDLSYGNWQDPLGLRAIWAIFCFIDDLPFTHFFLIIPFCPVSLWDKIFFLIWMPPHNCWMYL